MNKILTQLIEEAYHLFSKYEFGNEMAVCDLGCCISKQNIQVLKNTKLKEIPNEAIYDYLGSATVANDVFLINQMRYLMPRILELMVKGEYLRHDVEILLDKLYCKNSHWQPKEIEFLARFAEHFFDSVLSSEVSEYLPFEVILMFDIAGLNTTDFLLDMVFENLERPKVLNQLVEEVMYGGFSNAFADDQFIQKINNWLQSAEVADKLTEVLLQAVEDDNLDDLTRYHYGMVFDMIND